MLISQFTHASIEEQFNIDKNRYKKSDVRKNSKNSKKCTLKIDYTTTSD